MQLELRYLDIMAIMEITSWIGSDLVARDKEELGTHFLNISYELNKVLKHMEY